MEVGSPIRGGTCNWRWDLQLEVTPPIGNPTSDWRWGPPIRGGLCIGATQGHPMLHVGILIV